MLDEIRRGQLKAAGKKKAKSGQVNASDCNGDLEASLVIQKLEKVKLISGDATKMGSDFERYSHVYIYDKVRQEHQTRMARQRNA